MLGNTLAFCRAWKSVHSWRTCRNLDSRALYLRQTRPRVFLLQHFATGAYQLRQRPINAVIKYRPLSCSLLHTTGQSGSETTSPSLSQDCAGSKYIPPATGLLGVLPKAWVPYAELIRLDKPTGAYYLFFPCLFSTLLAAPLGGLISTPWEVASTLMAFFVGSIVMRGAGCAINDLWDRDLDPHVQRTRLRPLARRAISPGSAIMFTGAQLVTGLGILLQFPVACLWYGIPSLLLVTLYPLAKRYTHYPQFVLGLTFSWGAIMGFPALGVDVLDAPTVVAMAALYASCVSWTVLYDTIYAHMDAKDDVKAGIKSIALKHQDKSILWGLAATQVGLLAISGIAAGAGPIFFVGSCGGASLALGMMIRRVRLNDAKDCWWWFKNGCWFTGGGIGLGMLGDYVAQLFGLYEGSEETDMNDRQDVRLG